MVNITFKAIDTQKKEKQLRDVLVTIKFGEYANPSFEAQVETVAKGKTGRNNVNRGECRRTIRR